MKPEFRHTDIIGALIVASQLCNKRRDSGQNVLVLFSDMRHSMPDLNLESPSSVPSLSDVRKQAQIIPADLRRVRVYALGLMEPRKILHTGRACGDSGASTFWKPELICSAFLSCATCQTSRLREGK